MGRNAGISNSKAQTPNSRRVGIDQGRESEARYADIPLASDLDERPTNREQALQKKIGAKGDTHAGEAIKGSGSKTEGAFGKDNTAPDESINARYRKDTKEKTS